MASTARTIRNIAGIAAVVGLAIGVWLADLFNGFGTGESGPPAVAVSLGEQASQLPAPPTKEETTPDPSGEAPAEVATVIIDDRQYLLQTGETQTPKTLEQIVATAQAAPGNADGLKLKVVRRPSSRSSVEVALQDALKAAGLPETAIYWVPAPVAE